jgi:hypothetical protein
MWAAANSSASGMPSRWIHNWAIAVARMALNSKSSRCGHDYSGCHGSASASVRYRTLASTPRRNEFEKTALRALAHRPRNEDHATLRHGQRSLIGVDMSALPSVDISPTLSNKWDTAAHRLGDLVDTLSRGHINCDSHRRWSQCQWNCCVASPRSRTDARYARAIAREIDVAGVQQMQDVLT